MQGVVGDLVGKKLTSIRDRCFANIPTSDILISGDRPAESKVATHMLCLPLSTPCAVLLHLGKFGPVEMWRYGEAAVSLCCRSELNML